MRVQYVRQARNVPVASGAQLPVHVPGLPCHPRSGVTDQLVAVVLTIERFWRPALINSVLPVLLVAFLVGGRRQRRSAA